MYHILWPTVGFRDKDKVLPPKSSPKSLTSETTNQKWIGGIVDVAEECQGRLPREGLGCCTPKCHAKALMLLFLPSLTFCQSHMLTLGWSHTTVPLTDLNTTAVSCVTAFVHAVPSVKYPVVEGGLLNSFSSIHYNLTLLATLLVFPDSPRHSFFSLFQNHCVHILKSTFHVLLSLVDWVHEGRNQILPIFILLVVNSTPGT